MLITALPVLSFLVVLSPFCMMLLDIDVTFLNSGPVRCDIIKWQ